VEAFSGDSSEHTVQNNTHQTGAKKKKNTAAGYFGNIFWSSALRYKVIYRSIYSQAQQRYQESTDST